MAIRLNMLLDAAILQAFPRPRYLQMNTEGVETMVLFLSQNWPPPQIQPGTVNGALLFSRMYLTSKGAHCSLTLGD